MYWAIGNQTDQKPDDDNDVEDHVKADDGDDGDGDGDDDGIINQTDQKPDDADGGDDLWKIRKNFNISFSCLFQADGGLLMLQIRDRNENISVGISALLATTVIRKEIFILKRFNEI